MMCNSVILSQPQERSPQAKSINYQTTDFQPEKIPDLSSATIENLPLEKMDIEEKLCAEVINEDDEEGIFSEKKRVWRFRKALSSTQDDNDQASQRDQHEHRVPDPIDDLYRDENVDPFEFTQFTQTQSDVLKKLSSQKEGDDSYSVNHMLSELMASQVCWGTQHDKVEEEEEKDDEEEEDESVVPQLPRPFSKEREKIYG